jgi:RimJ/RimL family protein N-acetyltransferase
MHFDFRRLSSIPAATWLKLLNHPDVHRHMPLAGTGWTEQQAADWARAKDAQWQENGYGPWAIVVDGAFAGWGGFQKEDADVDFALVLRPAFWGIGRTLHETMLARGFDELGFDSITIMLPPSRVRLKSLPRLGYQPEGELEYAGHRFLKFRLSRARASRLSAGASDES